MSDKARLIPIKSPLATQNYTRVLVDESKEPNRFLIDAVGSDDVLKDILTKINFQTGPVKEVGVNGVFNEDLLLIVLHRLEYFQKGDYACKENEEAIKKIEEALMWLGKRTKDRDLRNVLGTYNK